MTNLKVNKTQLLLSILCFLISFFSIAQELTAEIDGEIPTEGFYQIMVHPEIRAYTKNDFSNFRLYDSKNQEVPYLLKQYNNQSVYHKIHVLKIIDKGIKTNENSTYIIENPFENISSLTLEITNTNINKTFSISGSHDQKNWYGVSMNNQTYFDDYKSTTNIKLNVDFPKMSYKYIKFVFDDKKNLPIEILQFYFKENFSEEMKLLPVAIKSFKKEDFKFKKTRLSIDFSQPETVDLISFNIKNPKLFQREVSIYGVEKNEELVFINRFKITHTTEKNIVINIEKQKKIVIDIDNLDSPPLDIEEVLCYQKPLFVSAWLNPNEKYLIKTNIKNAKRPIYDLAFFENDIEKNQIIGLQMKNIKVEEKKVEEKITEDKALWQQPWFMWLCIIIGGLTLLFFVRSLVKDMGS